MKIDRNRLRDAGYPDLSGAAGLIIREIIRLSEENQKIQPVEEQWFSNGIDNPYEPGQMEFAIRFLTGRGSDREQLLSKNGTELVPTRHFQLIDEAA